ncbi:MAG: hypothetical protein COV08_01990 [Candidatus Vogelbacteria bacterium CG10_big_fil_rev_8_21_14_0_10_49_38]|uniref:RNA 2',3'-cyclic 3'-phosphodiesterase n=1 Tax=Candidatus Vogelbacteria bacterium CG10_big_fil_rev_8_21_14_0_10_49_38 TaxID=1975043 RepID=A0A2H0RJ25_9BACT|nr:MAG: hypothetical protein BK006_02010 [bacterium CG10_49_38]PIR46024.1 MAG: hypothetical protein COV08_01990 [Candidatus Vogelbacteria bacterium CG10_big_fil_rev_8_21_14_0_10_49_38]
MNERLFLAFPIAGNLLQSSLDWQAGHGAWPARWLPAEALHLTLVAPWAETDQAAVVAKLAEFASSDLAAEIFRQPIEVEFSRIAFGPHRFAPRLIWAEGRAPVALLELKNRLEQAVARPDHRYYRLHLTLARFDPAEWLAQQGLTVLPELSEPISWPARFSGFALYRSVFWPDRVEYVKIKEFAPSL